MEQSPSPEDQSAETSNSTPPVTRRDLLKRAGLVGAVGAGIVGTTWAIGEKQGWGDIGKGGVNAKLLPKVGEPAPQYYTYTAADAQPVVLSELRGFPVWLNFWGSWCPPCKSEMPELQQAYESLHPRGLIMLAISQKESPQTALEYARRSRATFPILGDPNYLRDLLPPEQQAEFDRMLSPWQINNYPTHIFIDRAGIVQAVVLKPMNYETAMSYGELILNAVPATPTPVSTPVATPSASPVATPAAEPA